MIFKSVLFTIIFLGSFCAADARSFDSIQNNNEGVEDFEAKHYTAAYEKFIKSLAEEPYDPQLQFNLGVSFEGIKEPEKALKQYEQVLEKNQDPNLEFATLFNKARLLGEKKEIDQALEVYQKALALNPQSKEVKHNIELLTQQQQGGGKGDNQDKKKQQDQGDQQQQQQPQQPNQQDKKKKEFKSKDLTKDDVRRILDELKRQEQKIRAKHMREKDQKNGRKSKDW